MVAELTSTGRASPREQAHAEAEGEAQPLKELRTALQQLDGEFLRLFAERQRLARRAGEIKWKRGWPLYDPTQATKHLALLLREGVRWGLSHEDIHALYQGLHRAALNEQRRIAPPANADEERRG